MRARTRLATATGPWRPCRVPYRLLLAATQTHSCACVWLAPCPPARLNLSFPSPGPWPGRPSSCTAPRPRLRARVGRGARAVVKYRTTGTCSSRAEHPPGPVLARTPGRGRDIVALTSPFRLRFRCCYPAFCNCTHTLVAMRCDASPSPRRGGWQRGPSHRTLPARRNERPGWRWNPWVCWYSGLMR